MNPNQTPSGQQTISQIRGQEAWQSIRSIKDEESNLAPTDHYHNEYGTLARGLPAMIQKNGLAPTIAFLLSKSDKTAHQRLATHLENRVRNHLHIPDNQSLMVFIQTTNTDQYRRATIEIIEFANWIKRYVEAEGWKSSEDRP